MTTKYKVNITKHAQKDLEHIYYYIAEDSIANASKFILEIEKKIYTLERFPYRHPLIAENEYFETDYRHLLHKKYRIIYRIVKNVVYILRIIHGAKLYEL
jgi:toxin ParE1/3/4